MLSKLHFVANEQGRDWRSSATNRGGGPDLARIDDLLRTVLQSSGEPPRQLRRDYEAPRPSVDAAGGTECDRRGVGVPGSASVRVA